VKLRWLYAVGGRLGLACLSCLGWGVACADAPRNVILMIGDGMGPAQLELARRFAADGRLVMDRLDSSPGFATTHNSLGEITDSAAAATALATGRKTRNGAISMVPDPGDPSNPEAFVPVETAWERAEAGGKTTGILSSVYLADATPGVWAAHSTNRYNHREIALQQAADNPAGDVEVLLGAGRPHYLPQDADGNGDRNLIEELRGAGYEIVRDERELLAATAPNGKLLGLFGDDAMTYVLNRPLEKNLSEPTLAQMTGKALEILGRNPEGFFLVVEGGAIDWRGHERDPAGVLREVQAFDAAVAVALDFATRGGDTLLIVTADHETGGLALPSGPDALSREFLAGIRATSDFIWEEIQGGMALERAMQTYAGIGDAWPVLTRQEKRRIESCEDGQGIADVWSARAGLTWGWSGCESGHHTPAKVPVFASGPGAEQFDGSELDNTDIGKLLFDAVSGN
jgi:alkaline phosphatase